MDEVDPIFNLIDTVYMTIQQWEYVINVADRGSFTAAAEDCNVTQPTLSAQIAKLEDELGVVLIDRAARPMRASADARDILRQAREALQIMQAIPVMAAEQRSSLGGSLRIGIIPTLGPYLLPRFLGDFISAHPNLKMSVSEINSDDIIEGIRADRLDIGILALPSGTSGLVEESLFLEEFYAYLPPGFAYGDGKTPAGRVDIRRLGWEGMLLLTEGHCLRDQIIDLCKIPERRRSNALEFASGSLESLKLLVERGLGYTLIPELAASGENRESKCHILPLASPAPARDIGILRHPGFIRHSLLAHLKEHISRSLPESIRRAKNLTTVPWKTTGG